MSETPEGGLPGGDETEPSYRAILFDAVSQVHSVIPILVSDDETAKVGARRMADGLNAELWDGLRFIERYDGA